MQSRQRLSIPVSDLTCFMDESDFADACLALVNGGFAFTAIVARNTTTIESDNILKVTYKLNLPTNYHFLTIQLHKTMYTTPHNETSTGGQAFTLTAQPYTYTHFHSFLLPRDSLGTYSLSNNSSTLNSKLGNKSRDFRLIWVNFIGTFVKIELRPAPRARLC